MDTPDTIAYLAQAEARRVRRFLHEESLRDLDGDSLDTRPVPYFTLRRQPTGRVEVSGHNHVGHDNESRMSELCHFLRTSVLPHVDSEADVSGHYRVELHDSYAYLPDADSGKYSDVLTFSRPKATRARVGLLPDAYQMGGYRGIPGCDAQMVVPPLLAAAYRMPWSAKRREVLFVGCTTGDRDPTLNERIATCVWALDHKDVCDFRINAIVQMDPHDALKRVPRLKDVLAPAMSPLEHARYRYVANLSGNTACWSRVPMVLASRSVLFDFPQKDMTWYAPLLHEGEHYVGCSKLTIAARRAACDADPARCERIVASANRFVRDFLSQRHAAHYTTCLLEHMDT